MRWFQTVLLYVTFVLFLLGRTGVVHAQNPYANQGVAQQTQQVYNYGFQTVCRNGVCRPVYGAPPVMYRPQVVMQPYTFAGQATFDRGYGKPVRNFLFGRYRTYNVWTPAR